MILTQPIITSDWQGFNLEFNEPYLVVDYDVAIIDDVDEIETFLNVDYPDVVKAHNPQNKADWIECLSNCTTKPEHHKPNIYGEINANTEL